MSNTEMQIARLRREMELLKSNQVVIFETEPKEPSKQSIWRSENTTKWWDGKNWQQDSAGGILAWSSSVVFSSSARNNISWSSGVVNLGTEQGTATHAISAGSFTMTTNTFVYWAPDMPNTYQTTTNPEDAIRGGGIIIAVGTINPDVSSTQANVKTFGTAQPDIIIGDQIVANAITANKLAAQLVYAGSLILAANGQVRGGQTAFNTGTGFFLGYSGGGYKLSIGDSSANYFTYDGSSMIINGGTIRTAPTGARVEISGSNIRAYSATGTYPGFQTSANGYRLGYETGGLTYSSDTYIESFTSGLVNVRVQGRIKSEEIQTLGNATVGGGLTVALGATVGSDLTVSGVTYCNGKLKIPVGTNLY